MTGKQRLVRTQTVRMLGALALATIALTSCGRTVTGTPIAEGAYAGNPDRFSDVLQECDAVSEEQIAETVGADQIDKGFLGAICRWDALTAGGPVKVTFNWFETGTLDTEQRTGEQLGYAVETTTVQGRRAVSLRPPNDPGACGVSIGSPTSGVIGWWVQSSSGSLDACGAAVKLAELTVNITS